MALRWNKRREIHWLNFDVYKQEFFESDNDDAALGKHLFLWLSPLPTEFEYGYVFTHVCLFIQ